MLNILKSECPDVLDTSSSTQMAKTVGRQRRSSGSSRKDTHSQASCGTHFEEVLLGLGWEKEPIWECLFVHRKQGLFKWVYVDDIKVAGKKKNMAPMWKKLMKNVDLDEPTSYLDHENRVFRLLGGVFFQQKICK